MILEVLRRADDPNAFAVGMKQLKVVVDVQESTVQRVFALREDRVERSPTTRPGRARTPCRRRPTQRMPCGTSRASATRPRRWRPGREDEARQQVVLASLQAERAETEALLQRVATRQQPARARVRPAALRGGGRTHRRRGTRGRPSATAARRSHEPRGPLASLRCGRGAPDVGGHCPVLGAVAGRDFSNDWGYPRSGGRTHQGNDIFANEGVPVIAIQAGVVIRTSADRPRARRHHRDLPDRDGSEWYNAHLQTSRRASSPASRSLPASRSGRSAGHGNARTTPPHLHSVAGYNGSWVNPYPTIAPLCR
jgi:murein DD-endopeptidase MepM/ murein hydrolase activator NlpD